MPSTHNVYAALDDVRSLLGRREPIVYIGDTPDIRTCRWLVKTVVRHNFHKHGYIALDNGWLCEISTRHIEGRNDTVYMFSGSRVLDVVWSRYALVRTILESAPRIQENDCLELATRVVDEFWDRRTTYFWIHSRDSAMELLEEYVPQLGLPQLRNYGALLDEWLSKVSPAA